MGGSRPCSDPCRSELKGLEGVDRHERPLGMHSEQDTKGLAICQAAERLRSRLNSGELHNMLLPFSPKPLACMCARTTFVRVTYVDERRVDTPRTHKVSEQHPFSPNGRTATKEEAVGDHTGKSPGLSHLETMVSVGVSRPHIRSLGFA